MAAIEAECCQPATLIASQLYSDCIDISQLILLAAIIEGITHTR